MIARPCRTCGDPTPTGTHCAQCKPDPKTTAASRGYDAAWTRLSKRARKLQPFCSDCGATNDLQTDHSPEAWQRKAQGKAIRLQDVDVVCGPCNRRRGQARPSDQGRCTIAAGQRPHVKAQKALHFGLSPEKDGGEAA